MKHYTLEIEGMKCSGCAGSVEAHLREIAGAEIVTVSWQDGTATVEAGDEVSEESLTGALDGTPYKVKKVLGRGP